MRVADSTPSRLRTDLRSDLDRGFAQTFIEQGRLAIPHRIELAIAGQISGVYPASQETRTLLP